MRGASPCGRRIFVRLRLDPTARGYDGASRSIYSTGVRKVTRSPAKIEEEDDRDAKRKQ
jgi:hypothetical protein